MLPPRARAKARASKKRRGGGRARDSVFFSFSTSESGARTKARASEKKREKQEKEFFFHVEILFRYGNKAKKRLLLVAFERESEKLKRAKKGRRLKSGKKVVSFLVLHTNKQKQENTTLEENQKRLPLLSFFTWPPSRSTRARATRRRRSPVSPLLSS